jgi:succinate-acetate transporter protein
MSIRTILFVILLIAWMTGFTVMHVASGLIHILTGICGHFLGAALRNG